MIQPLRLTILADEDYPAPVSRALRDRGLSVEVIAGTSFASAVDRAVLDHAALLGGVLVSHNQRDRPRFREYVRSWRERGNEDVCALFLPRDQDDHRLLLRTLLLLVWYESLALPKPETLIWNDVAQALIHGYRPGAFSPVDIDHALGRLADRGT